MSKLSSGLRPKFRDGYALSGVLQVPRAIIFMGKMPMLEFLVPTGQLAVTSESGGGWIRGRSPSTPGTPTPKSPGLKQGSRAVSPISSIKLTLDMFQSVSPPIEKHISRTNLVDRQENLFLALSPVGSSRTNYRIPPGVLGSKWLVRLFAAPGPFLSDDTEIEIWAR